MKKYIFPVVILFLVGAGAVTHAAQINVSGQVPSISGQGSGVVGTIGRVYELALMSGGLLAFGAIVYGGIKYIASRGNPSQQSDARQWITQALLGLLLLVGAALILTTINPDAFSGGGLRIDLPSP